MYLFIHPGSERQLPMRMLFQPAGDGTFLRACEADSWRGLVAAILDDPDYETANAEDRLVERLRLRPFPVGKAASRRAHPSKGPTAEGP
jgi:hypothetical protein